ncbi:fibrinogen-like 1 [Limosa lapponica baueri]|uniref:Fibrinogen-like protein 1 n=1 Tax=Limosa lapponica baueri TaxID=1758121 RepID=A0A2I0THY4_LIMLA|nr:fibrinogen-like 1 [Limosa lapponica baueri]
MSQFGKDLQNCFQEQIRLQGQVRLLEHRVKQQQLKIIQLLEKKEIQYSDRGDENSVIDLGGKRQYSGNYTLRIDLTDFEGERRFAQYARFRVAGEEHSYEMSCGEYSGTAGDSLTGGFHPEVQWWADHRGMKFSTRDRDNDNYEGNCAEEEKAGWWFNRCHSANLNGLYYKGPYTAKSDNGIVWYTWHGWWYSLKSVVMKVRPADFEPNIV